MERSSSEFGSRSSPNSVLSLPLRSSNIACRRDISTLSKYHLDEYKDLRPKVQREGMHSRRLDELELTPSSFSFFSPPTFYILFDPPKTEVQTSTGMFFSPPTLGFMNALALTSTSASGPLRSLLLPSLSTRSIFRQLPSFLIDLETPPVSSKYLRSIGESSG